MTENVAMSEIEVKRKAGRGRSGILPTNFTTYFICSRNISSGFHTERNSAELIQARAYNGT